MRRREDVPLRRLGDVPLRRRWVFHLRWTCNVSGTYRETSLRRHYDVLLPGGEHLNAFENDLDDLIQEVEFTNVQNTFQQKLKKDVQSIKSSNDMLVFTYKSTNLYELSRDYYEKLLHDNITQRYQKMYYPTKSKTDREPKKFAKSLDLDERMECYSNQSAFITLKDNKVNFKNNTKCRLINPSKSEVCLVSKHYLSSIISMVAEKSGVNQWRNTSTAVKWFENLQNKQNRRFIKFDMADFYPSIAEHLLERSIEYAKRLLRLNIKHSKLYYLLANHYYLAKMKYG